MGKTDWKGRREGMRGRGARAAERNSAALLSANSGARGQEVRRRGASSLLSAALTGGGRTQQQASSHTKDNLSWKQNRQWRHDAKVKLPTVWKAVQDELELIKVDYDTALILAERASSGYKWTQMTYAQELCDLVFQSICKSNLFA